LNKAIIFDLDGVIVDTAKYHYLAWRKIALDLGFDFSEAQNEMLKGVSRVQSLEYFWKVAMSNLSQAQKERLLRCQKRALFIFDIRYGCL
jgi:beta-phosphoglucomutase